MIILQLNHAIKRRVPKLEKNIKKEYLAINVYNLSFIQRFPSQSVKIRLVLKISKPMCFLYLKNNILHRYNILGAKSLDKAKNEKAAAKMLFDIVGLENEKYRLGHTKV